MLKSLYFLMILWYNKMCKKSLGVGDCVTVGWIKASLDCDSLSSLKFPWGWISPNWIIHWLQFKMNPSDSLRLKILLNYLRADLTISSPKHITGEEKSALMIEVNESTHKETVFKSLNSFEGKLKPLSLNLPLQSVMSNFTLIEMTDLLTSVFSFCSMFNIPVECTFFISSIIEI